MGKISDLKSALNMSAVAIFDCLFLIYSIIESAKVSIYTVRMKPTTELYTEMFVLFFYQSTVIFLTDLIKSRTFLSVGRL